jgi:tetratricopeptide (TPR) repeat protein
MPPKVIPTKKRKKGSPRETSHSEKRESTPFSPSPHPPTTDKFGGFSGNKQLIISCLLAVVTFIAFYQITQSEFINYDDGEYVTENKHIRGGLTVEGMVWAFTAGHSGNWHPLTWISHMVDVQIFGLHPGWHHLINLLFHLANTLLLFFILCRMTRALWQSAFVAALFALHPLHVESVAWVAERKDVLSTFFWMLTMGTYVFYVARPGLIRYLVVILFFTLGLMAKPMLVTLPFILLLLDYWPLQRPLQKEPSRKVLPLPKKEKSKGVPTALGGPVQPAGSQWSLVYPLLVEKIPFFILAIFSSIITYLVQSQGGAVSSLQTLPLGARIANAFIAYIAYIAKMIWPMNLAVLYPHPGSRPFWQVLGAAIALILLTVLVFRRAKKHPFGVVGWLWYLISLVPVIGIIQVGSHSMADRYTYVPLIGLFVIVAWGITELTRSWPYRTQTLITLSVLSLFCLTFLTWRQVGYWRNNITLYDHTLEVTDRNSIIYSNRGLAYSNSLGRNAEAIIDFNKAIEISPSLTKTYNNRGLSYDHLGNFQQAMRDFDKAIELDPGFAAVYNNRGITYRHLSNFQQAIGDFDKAIELDPGYAAAYNNRGIAYGNLGNPQQAMRDFDKAVELDPRYAAAYNNRGIAYGNIGNFQQAMRDFDKAIELDPGYAAAYNERGLANGKTGNNQQAMRDFDRAIALNPGYAAAYNNRGLASASLGNFQEAIKDFDKAIKLEPKASKIYMARGLVYTKLKENEQAIRDFRVAAQMGERVAQDLLKEKGESW